MYIYMYVIIYIYIIYINMYELISSESNELVTAIIIHIHHHVALSH